MRRIFALVFLLLFGSFALGQEVPARTEFALRDLLLVSHAGIPGGTAAHRGPMSAAILMAWFSHHGYPALLPDLNGDGKQDEADIVLLAVQFAKEMGVEPDRPARDPQLMDALARYVSERYPKEFSLKIWDDTFVEEYRAVFGKPFSPGDYPLIEIELKGNAGHADYTGELLSGEGVILGLGQERETNAFFVGRSFQLAEAAEGWPVDFVDTSDDPFQAGLQGQILSTWMRPGPTHTLVRYGDWTLLEFMLSLSPLRKPGAEGTPKPCAPGAMGYDVVTVETEWGKFKVEECVVREGDRDLYRYTVSNLSFQYAGCGICEFYLPNFHSFSTLSQWGPAGWLVNPWGEWSWRAPLGDCGILPGTAAEFGFAVPAPTTDTWQGAGVGGCVPVIATAVLQPPFVKFRTTGPGPGETGCPDLAVVKLYACWRMTALQEVIIEVTVVIQNVGTAASGSSWVCTSAGSAWSIDHVGSLAPGATDALTVTFNLGPIATFPIVVEAEADCMSYVKECNETNNKASFSVGRLNTCK